MQEEKEHLRRTLNCVYTQGYQPCKIGDEEQVAGVHIVVCLNKEFTCNTFRLAITLFLADARSKIDSNGVLLREETEEN